MVKVKPAKKLSTPSTDYLTKFRYLIVLALALVVYSTAFQNGYNLDDELVTRNHRLTSRGVAAIGDIFSQPYYADEAGYSYEYRPIVLVTFAIEHTLLGENPVISHSINILLYALACCLLLLLMEKFGIPSLLALAATVIFTVHPVHTEAVASIKNRDEILVALFGICSLLGTLHYANGNRLTGLLFIWIFTALTLLSKVSGIIFPMAMPLIAIRHAPSLRYRDYLPLMLPFLVVLLIYLISYRPGYTIALPAVAILGYSFLFLFMKKQLSSISADLQQSIYRWKGWLQVHLSRIKTYNYKADPAGLRCWLLLILLAGITLGSLTGQMAVSLTLLTLAALMLTLIPGQYVKPLEILLVGLSLIIPSLFFFKDKTFVQSWIAIPLTLYVINQPSRERWMRAGGVFLSLLLTEFVLWNDPAAIAKLTLIQCILFGLLWFAKHRWLSWPVLLLAAILAGTNLRSAKEYYDVGYPVLLIIFFLFIRGKIHREQLHRLSLVIFLALLVQLPVAGRLGLHPLTTTIQYAFFEDQPDALSGGYPLPQAPPASEQATSPSGLNLLPDFNRPLNFVEYPIAHDAPFLCKLGTSLLVLGRYLRLVTLAYPLSYYYGYKVVEPNCMGHFLPWLILLIHLVLLMVALRYRKAHPWFANGIFLYLLFIFPFSGLVIPIAGLLGDRYLLVPSIGYALSLAALLLPPKRPSLARAGKWIFILITLIYSIHTLQRNRLWKDPITLMTHDITHLHNSAQANNLLATNLMQASMTEKDPAKTAQMRNRAITHFKRALEIYPDFFNAWVDLGRAYLTVRDLENAYTCFLKASAIDSTLPDVSLKIALIADQKGDYKMAIRHYNNVIALNPAMKETYANLSYLYYRLGNFQKSIEVNQQAIRFNPNWPEPYENISRVYQHLGDEAQAMEFHQKAMELKRLQKP
ncbi:MAG: hypothetical protein KatS3mg031_0045 [Chitinophagales bacterium]|nr:MAG: hypothetical protein KatS3mg031_0045 [Chitinophagales bacterium]